MDRSHAVRLPGRDVGRWRRWRGWVTAALLAACVDGPTSPGMFGELRIRPTYSDGDVPAALGLSVDSAKVRVVRESEPTIALIDTMVRYESDTTSMGWVLELRSQEEPLLVDLSLWDDDSRVYAGEREVVVREAAIAESGAEAVVVAYVGPAIVQTITVTPESVTLEALNAVTPYTAQALDRHGQVVATEFAWTSGNPDVASVDPASGVVTAVGNGTAAIQAAAGSAAGSATIVVAQRVATVGVAPASQTLTALGATQKLQASVLDANGFAVADASIAWTSSDAAVVSVDGTGTITAVSGGTATVTASSGGMVGTARVTVNPVADVASVTVSPVSATLTRVGATTQFTAVARDAGNRVLSGVQFVFTSSAPDVATIDASGLARAAGHGSTSIIATAGAVAGSATLAVDLTTTVARIAVSPTAATLTAVGATRQFTAEARDAGGTRVPGVTVVWSSQDEDVATVDAASGLATAVGHGSTIVRATVGEVQGIATLAVELTATIARVTVAPANVILNAVGSTQQFIATATDASGAVVPGVAFEWTSSATTVASIGQTTGLAVVAGHGNTTITAMANDVAGTATLTADLTTSVASIVVMPANVTLSAVGATQEFTAQARDANGSVVPGVVFVWTSSTPAVADVGRNTGLATAATHGATTITATGAGHAASAALTVNLSSSVAGVVVVPASATLTSLGATQQFMAQGRDTDGAIVPGMTFSWSSSAENVATIADGSGLATVTGHGSTTITATANAVSGAATLTADLAPTITSIRVSPANATLTSIGGTQQFTAVARDANNAVVSGVTFGWSSSNEAAATIDAATGLATATGHGTTNIVASIGDIQGFGMLSVELIDQTAAVTVEPTNVTLTTLGATQQFTATARDANGAVIPGVPFVWSSSDAGVATVVEGSGLATVTGDGTATITAAAGAASGTASLTAELSATVTSIVVSPASHTLTALGATQLYTAVARDANNTIVPGVSFAWSSSNESAARIDPVTGLATAVGHGSTSVIATIGDVQGSALLSVELRTSTASITVVPASVTLTSLGATQQFTATARDANGAIIPGVPFVWSSGAEGVATIGESSGLATVTGDGTTTISASVNGASGTATLTADLDATVTSIVVSPPGALLGAKGSTQQFTAVARDANDAVVPGVSFVWSSSTEFVATVDPATGLATAHGHGNTTITATLGDVRGSAPLSVDLTPSVATIVISPYSAKLYSLGVTQQFTAEARDAQGEVIPGMTFSWSSSSADVAIIDGTGLATSVGNGATTIRATAGAVSKTAQLTVHQKVVRVEVMPNPAAVVVGSFTQLSATAYDANDHVVVGRSVSWWSSDDEIAEVNASGLVEGIARGTVTIKAFVDDVRGSATVSVACPLPPAGGGMLASIIVC